MRPATLSQRCPRFGDFVLLEERRYRVCATMVAPTRGYWLRPEGAEDAGQDHIIAAGDLTWNRTAERWEGL